LSVGGVDLYNKIYNPLLLDVERVKGPDCYRCPYQLHRDTCQAECFEHMIKAIEQHHEDIAAVIVEPMVQAAAGMLIYSKEYLVKLRALCTKYDIQMIADEIAVGFGRTGKMFACNHAGIAPDIMCVSKGLTAGYMPLSLVVLTDTLYNAFYDDYETMKAFLHSHSYSGNPLGCAVANETFEIFKDENILEKNLIKSSYIKKKVEEELMDLPYVGEFRQLGMIGALELVEDTETKKPFDWEKRVGYHIYKIALDKGVLLRPLGNIVYFMPPYVITEEEIDKMIKVARESIITYFE